jgi:hypothetical protein
VNKWTELAQVFVAPKTKEGLALSRWARAKAFGKENYLLNAAFAALVFPTLVHVVVNNVQSLPGHKPTSKPGSSSTSSTAKPAAGATSGSGSASETPAAPSVPVLAIPAPAPTSTGSALAVHASPVTNVLPQVPAHVRMNDILLGRNGCYAPSSASTANPHQPPAPAGASTAPGGLDADDVEWGDFQGAPAPVCEQSSFDAPAPAAAPAHVTVPSRSSLIIGSSFGGVPQGFVPSSLQTAVAQALAPVYPPATAPAPAVVSAAPSRHALMNTILQVEMDPLHLLWPNPRRHVHP